MNYAKYNLNANSDLTIFEFLSSGALGDICKVIQFTTTKNPEIINLGFGDKINVKEDGTFDIDDLNITDNGDRNIVLSTVANSIYIFTQMYSDKFIFFRGSCKIRTRLYRMSISMNYLELQKTFIIFGIVKIDEDKYESTPFDSYSEFIGFLIKRK